MLPIPPPAAGGPAPGAPPGAPGNGVLSAEAARSKAARALASIAASNEPLTGEAAWFEGHFYLGFWHDVPAVVPPPPGAIEAALAARPQQDLSRFKPPEACRYGRSCRFKLSCSRHHGAEGEHSRNCSCEDENCLLGHPLRAGRDRHAPHSGAASMANLTPLTGGANAVGAGSGGGGGGGGGAAASGSWRIKFLYKVGVADGGGGLAGSPTGTPVGSPQPGRRADMPFDTASSAAAPDAVSLPVVASSRESEAEREGGEVVLVRQRMVKARSSSDIRKGYIAKLRESEKLLPQLTRPREAQTVTIFDWDDTLLCTTHLEMMQRQQGSLPPQVREQLAALEAIVSQLLTAASANGKVFIITNASEGWVQHSSSMCFPNLQPLLAPVVIISARAGSETQPPRGSLHSSLSLSLHSSLLTGSRRSTPATRTLGRCTPSSRSRTSSSSRP